MFLCIANGVFFYFCDCRKNGNFDLLVIQSSFYSLAQPDFGVGMAAQPLQAATTCKKPFPLVTVRKIANCNYNFSFTNILSGFPEALILCP